MSTPQERYRPTMRALAERVRAEHGGPAAHLVMRAYEHTGVRLDGTFRLNGDPYLAHAVAVAQIAAGISADPTVVAAALLHGVGARTSEEQERLRSAFGSEVADLSDAVSTFDRCAGGPPRGPGPLDDRVLLLRLSHRLHSLHTIEPLRRDDQVSKARHTLTVLVPLAERRGLALAVRLRAAAAHTIAPSGRPARRRRGVAVGIVTAVAMLVPHSERERWASEWRGELGALPSAWARLRFAVDVALGAPSLAVVTRRART